MSHPAVNFSSIPILDYSFLSNPRDRESFILELRHALINVGFLYIKNHTIPQKLIDRLVYYAPELFDVPQEAKDNIKTANSEHFLGYSRLGTERTKGQVDQREQFDFATEQTCPWKNGDPDYYRLLGPCQWLDEEVLPGFREILEEYLEAVEKLSYHFSSLVSEALGLGPDGLSHFYSPPEFVQHRLKIVKYPVVTGSNDQGVGPHCDSGFLTFLLQASPHQGLQVQNFSGEWIDVHPIPGTLVINIGKALELVTRGIARATMHRVLSPRGFTPRYSVPFSHNISLSIKLADEVLDFPPEILELRDKRRIVTPTDSINLVGKEPAGKIYLMGRVKSYPETAAIHYPELFKEIFLEGPLGETGTQ